MCAWDTARLPAWAREPPRENVCHGTFTRCFPGKAITVKAELTDTIGVIKRKMAEKEHVPPDQHNLMFAGEQLQDWHTLADYIEFVKRDKPLPKHYQTYDAVATQANHGFVFKKRTIKQVMEEEKKAEKEAATIRLQAASRGMLGRAKAREEFDTKMQQVNAAIKVQSIARRRLDQHKIDDLVQQKRVEQIIKEKESEEKQAAAEVFAAEEAASMFDAILSPFSAVTGALTGAAAGVEGGKAGGGAAGSGPPGTKKKEKRIPFTALRKSDVPPDGKFWANGYFVYWSDKHNRPYFYNPEVDETQWFPPEEENDDDDDIVEFSDEEEDMDEAEKLEHQIALKRAKLRRLRLGEQQKYRDALVTFREAVRKADVLDTGYLSEDLMNKLARNTGAIPAVEQQFFLALNTCSRNHHGDVNHEDFNECFKITLGYSKLSFEERLENNQAIKEMDTALSRADIRFSGLLPESTIRRIGVEYGIHKMRLELAMTVSPHGLGDLVKYEECLPNLQFVINGYRPSFSRTAIKEQLAKEKAAVADAQKGYFDSITPLVEDVVRRLSWGGPAAEEAARAAAEEAAKKGKDEESDSDDEPDAAAAVGAKDANVIADATKRQAEYEEMAGAASIIQSKFRQKKAMNQFYSKMCRIYMDKRLRRREDPNTKNVHMQILGGNLDSLETYKVTFEKPEPLRMVLKGVANRDPETGITHDFVVVTGFTRKENGSMGPAELGGEIGLMDFLVGVQGEELVGLTFNEVMAHLRAVQYPLTLQFIKNPELVPPDFEGWTQAHFPDFGNEGFHKEVLFRVKKTTIFQHYPDDFGTQLQRRYLELRGSELSYYKVAKGGAINANRVGFMDTSDVEKVRRLKCWDQADSVKYQLILLMKAAGGEAVRFAFASERDVDGWAVAVGAIADVDPSPWEDVGKDPDEEYEEEVVEYRAKDETVQLRTGIQAKYGLPAGDRCTVANIDSVKGVVYVKRLKDKREFGPFRHNDLMPSDSDDFEVEVPAEGYRGSVLGEKVTMWNSDWHRRLRAEGSVDAKGNVIDPREAALAEAEAGLDRGPATPGGMLVGALFSAVGMEPDEALMGALGEQPAVLRRKFHFAPTETVLVLRFGNLWYMAVVAAIDEEKGTYSVEYDDGDEEAGVEMKRVMAYAGYEYEVSDPVEAKRFGKKWYKAVVEGKNIGRPGSDPTYDIRYVDTDDLELAVEVPRLRVSTGFVYNEKALRKLVPNRPRMLTGEGVGGASAKDEKVTKEILSLQQQLARLARGEGLALGPGSHVPAPPDPLAAMAGKKSGGGSKSHARGLERQAKPGKPIKSERNSIEYKLSAAKASKKASAEDGAGKAAVSKWDPATQAPVDDKPKRGGKPGEVHGIAIGATFQKTFEGHGTFTGTVVEYSKEKKFFSVIYEDGDTEELKIDDLRALMGMPPRKRKPKA